MGFFSSGFGRLLGAGLTWGSSELFQKGSPFGGMMGAGIGALYGGPSGAATGMQIGNSLNSMLSGGGSGSAASQDAIQLATAQNMYNSAQVQKQMDFQERMSSTAHQREVADLRAAGLNPILSVNHGGASTPTGASIPAVDVSATVANSALKQQEISNTFLKIMSEVALNATQANKNISETLSTEQDTLLKKFKNLGIQSLLDQEGQPGYGNAQGQAIQEWSSSYQKAQYDKWSSEIKEQEKERQKFINNIVKNESLSSDQKYTLLKGDVEQQLAVLAEMKNKKQISESNFGLFITILERMVGIGSQMAGMIKPGVTINK